MEQKNVDQETPSATFKQQIVDRAGNVLSERSLGNNVDFVMIQRKAFIHLRDLGKDNAKARVLYDFFLESMDKTNSLIASRETLAGLMTWSVPTIDRCLKHLRENNFIEIYKSGTSNIYCINALIAWTTHANKKQFAKFKANIIISKTEQDLQQKILKGFNKSIGLKDVNSTASHPKPKPKQVESTSFAGGEQENSEVV